MSQSYFHAPEAEAMSALLPAFDFTAKIAADELKVVYLAQHVALERQVVVKLYSPEASQQPWFREAFEGTLRLMARLKHVNLIGIYDSGEVQGMLYQVEEFVAGKPMWNSTKGNAIHVKHVRPLMEGICAGLAHAHDHGVYHGELSLYNILINQEQQPKIGGFRQMRSSKAEVERFRAPELDHSQSVATIQSDIYSLGAIVYELISGHPHSQDAPPPKVSPTDMGMMQKFWRKATALDPAVRHASVAEFLQECVKALDGSPLKTTARVNVGPAALKMTGRVQVGPPLKTTSRVAVGPAAALKVTSRVNVGPPVKATSHVQVGAPLKVTSRVNVGEAPLKATSRVATSVAAPLKAPGAGPASSLGLSGRASSHSVAAAAMLNPEVQSATLTQKLIRNVIIIIVLLFAIYVVWGIYKRRTQHTTEPEIPKSVDRTQQDLDRFRQEQQRRHEALKKQQAEAARARVDNRVAAPEPTTPVPAAPVADDGVSTQLASFARLREALVAGSRAEMPEGTKSEGDSSFCLVRQPMTWREASTFAQHHGGHIAIPSGKADFGWMREQLAAGAKTQFWIGASRSGREAWTLADGRAWKPAKDLAAEGSRVALAQANQLVALGDDVELPFAIQWHANGSNPGALESLLQATRKTIEAGQPVYPPGTCAFGVRHYLFVPEEVTWDQACKLARLGGGHLAVATGLAETFNLKKLCNSLQAEHGIWIGGTHHPEKGWSWITGEKWDVEGWPVNRQSRFDSAGLIISPGKNEWEMRSRETPLSGFLIEWSTDAAKASAR